MFKRYRELQERRENGDSLESGFTLIELLIVIVVLGILAAIVIFSLTGVTGQSEQAACNTDAKTVEVAVTAYEAQNSGSTPASLAALSPTYLHTVPSATTDNNGYAISLSGSNVQVATKANPATNYDSTTNPCSTIPS